ncbi:MAG: galactokinase [Propionibacteriaceae bacterium]
MTLTDDNATPDLDDLARVFADRLGDRPQGIWAAPGRVNVIGEHTDYNDGYVMPFALAQRTALAVRVRDDGRWRVTSTFSDEVVAFGPDDLQPGTEGWHAYVAGVVWALREAGHEIPGADFAVSSTVPIGAGLSSSAALECATMTALADLAGLDIGAMDRAKLARVAENAYVGAPTGLMDQAASTLCTADHALFLDCRTLATEQVPLDLTAAGYALLVLDTNTPHALVDSEYAERRRSCETAARILGVAALRDVTDLDDALGRLDEDLLRRRVRHVVTENERVLAARFVLDAEGPVGLAPLLDASHASMRDDFEITVPTVDLAVVAAREAGALGARMTGGGFGGCIIALTPADEVAAVAAHVHERFAAAGYNAPRHFVAHPSPGAVRVG